MKTFWITVISVFVALEATAAIWHLALFKSFYDNQLVAIQRPFDEYIVPYLISTNAIRSIAIVAFFHMFSRRFSVSLRDGILFGGFLGLVCGLMVAEYYGVWNIRSIVWALVEGIWSVLQGVTVGSVLGMFYQSRASSPTDASTP
ncbi:MAG: hypothetical protein OHK0029_38490 [Armatimonadaceae bacterium]